MYWISDNLYLSGRRQAACGQCLIENKITHVLTVDSEQPPSVSTLCDKHALASEMIPGQESASTPTLATYHRLHIFALDIPDFLLIDEFPRCFEFIDKAFASSPENNVLVNCLVGVSRSATVIIGYLMQASQLSMQITLRLVLSRKPDIQPNQGFLQQLELFEAMEWKVDHKSAKYGTFQARNKQLPKKMNWRSIENNELNIRDVESVDSTFTSSMVTHAAPLLDYHELSEVSSLTIDVQSITSLYNEDHVETVPEKKFYYKCRVCRTEVLFSTSDIQAHEQKHPTIKCSSVFLANVPKWMSQQIDGIMQGRLVCGRCDAKLGSFNWTGERCSCGEWFTPAFQVHCSKVDAHS